MLTGAQAAGARAGCPGSLYGHVRRQLDCLISKFGIESFRPEVFQAYDLVSREAMDFPCSGPPPRFSTINENGTPFQYGVMLAQNAAPWLAFLGEAGPPAASPHERLLLSRDRIRKLANVLDATKELDAVEALLDSAVPDNLEIENDPGTLWLGGAFSAGARPRLKVYVNVRWGSEEQQWARVSLFVATLSGRTEWWRRAEDLISAMSPLGLAVSVTKGSAPSGRIYLSAYGRPAAFYERAAAHAAGPSFSAALRQSAIALLGDDYRYPTQTVVCSFGFDGRANPDLKIELCGHCFFASDIDARQRCLRWLDCLNIDPSAYASVVQTLSAGRLSSTHARLHSYVGVGHKCSQTYCSMYFKPSP